MHHFFLGFALALQKFAAISFGLDDLSDPRGDLLSLMRPNFLFNCDLVVMIGRVVFVLSFRKGESFIFGVEFIERGRAGDSIDGFLVGLYVEDSDVVLFVIEGIGASLY